MSVKISGQLENPLDVIVKQALHRALDAKPQEFRVHISRPHSELVVTIQQPFERTLKFQPVNEAEIARELSTALTAIVDDELSKF